MSISIDDSIARDFGLESAYIVGVIRKSEAAKALHPDKYTNHFHDGFYWMFATYEEWAEKYPFLGCAKSVQRKLTALVNAGVLIQGRFNRKKYDKTNWYRRNDKSAYYSSKKESGSAQKRLDNSSEPTGQFFQSDRTNLPDRLDNFSEASGQNVQTYTCIHLTNSSTDSSSVFPAARADDVDESVQEPKRISVPRNQRDFEEPLNPEPEPKELTPIQQMAAELVALGVDQITAEALVINHKEAVRSQLDWLPHRNARIPAVYVVKAIRESYPPPQIILEQQAEIERKAVARAEADRLAKELKDRDQQAKSERNDPEAQAKARAAIEEIKRLKGRGAA